MTTTRTRAPGELESEVLQILRQTGDDLTARDIRQSFTDPVPAYTTILTALSRLTSKGDVVRTALSPRRTRFRAAQSAEENASASMTSALSAANDREVALLAFAGSLTHDDLALLRRAIDARATPDAR